MKKIYLILVLACAQISVAQTVNAYGDLSPTIGGESAFLDASAFTDVSTNLARGLVFPRTNLNTFTFVSEGSSFGNFATGYDGMVIYNTVSGTTPATGSGIGQQLVSPGFYFFSNPASEGDTVTGRWLPIAGAGNGIKTKEVLVTTPVVYNEAKLDLGTSVIGVGEVGTFLGAKIYEAGKLIMTADSDYITATNVLTTGNGYMFQLLKANTQYKVVVEYK